jgi:hypothetical protein
LRVTPGAPQAVARASSQIAPPRREGNRLDLRIDVPPSARPSSSHDFRVTRDSRRAPVPSAPSAMTTTNSFESTGFIDTTLSGRILRIELGPGASLVRLTSPAMTRMRLCSPTEAGGAGTVSEPPRTVGDQALSFVIRLDDAVEAHSGVARDRKRQRRVALQVFERTHADHPPLVHQHHLVGEALDFGQIVRDVDDRQIEAVVQSLKKRQNLVLGRAIQCRERLGRANT